MLTPEYFAHILCQDMDSPKAAEFIPFIADAIRTQIEEFGFAAEDDPIIQESEFLEQMRSYGLIYRQFEEDVEDLIGSNESSELEGLSFNLKFRR